MTSPISPRIVKGGIVLVDPSSGVVQRIITLQYNPDTLTRTLQAQSMGDDADRSEALRLKGPPIETIRLEAEIDATDQLEKPNESGNDVAVSYGIFPQIAALETIIYPSSEQILANQALASQGKLEIVPMESALTLFVWSSSRVIPVRLTEFSVTEEAFDVSLNPIRARVTLAMRVLSVDDLGFSHRGGTLYLRYQQQKERLSDLFVSGAFSALGITGIT